MENFNPRTAENALVKFKAQEIANLVWSFATLNHKEQPIMDYFTDYIIYICSDNRAKKYDESTIAKCFKRQEIANIAWSCTILEQYPKQLMNLLYAGLFGVKDTDPKTLASIYDDDGLQRQAIMTMFYVQMALDFEKPELGLSLPPNFPSDWRETHDSNTYTPELNDEDEKLRITTSRLQLKVNEALNRCRRQDYVQEHIITTTDLQVNYDITLSNENQEFLSIDMADVESMNGVEVDGPGHFITLLDESGTFKQEVNGPTALKDRLLEHLEWYIMHIPYWKWRDLGGDEESEDEYLQGLFIEAGID